MSAPIAALFLALVVASCSDEFTASEVDASASGGTGAFAGFAGSGVGGGAAAGTGGSPLDASAGGSGGAGPDAAAGGTGGKFPPDGGVDAQVIAPCAPGKVGDLKEMFDATWTAQWSTWADPGAQASVASGVAQMKIQANTQAYVGFYTKQTWNIQDCAVSVEIIKVPEATVQNAELYFSATDANLQNGAIVTTYAGTLVFTHRIGGVKQGEIEVPYNPSTHRFWRFREASGTTYFETSPDGKKWSKGFQAPTNPEANAYFIEVAGGTWSPPPAVATTLQFDNVNVVP